MALNFVCLLVSADIYNEAYSMETQSSQPTDLYLVNSVACKKSHIRNLNMSDYSREKTFSSTVNLLKFQHFSFSVLKNMLVIGAEIYKVLV